MFWTFLYVSLAAAAAGAQTVTRTGTIGAVPVFIGASTVGNSPVRFWEAISGLAPGRRAVSGNYTSTTYASAQIISKELQMPRTSSAALLATVPPHLDNQHGFRITMTPRRQFLSWVVTWE